MFFEGLLAIIIFSFVPLAIKLTTASPLTICLFRLFVTVITLGLFWRKKNQFKSFLTLDTDNWKLWLIGFVFFFHWLSYAYGVKLGGPSIGVLGLSTYGIQLVLAGAFFLGHQVTRKDIFCLSLSMLGIFLIVPSWNFKNTSTQGLVLSLASAACFAIMPIIHRKTQMFTIETRIFAQFLGAFFGFFILIGKTNWNLQAQDWLLLLFLAVFGTLIAHSLWARVSAKSSPANTGLAYYTIAPLTIILSHFILAESFTHIQLVGAVIIVISSMINVISSKLL